MIVETKNDEEKLGNRPRSEGTEEMGRLNGARGLRWEPGSEGVESDWGHSRDSDEVWAWAAEELVALYPHGASCLGSLHRGCVRRRLHS